MKLGIKGIQEAQRANEHNIAGLRPTGSLGRAVQYATIESHRYAVSITHVDSGALRASQRMDVSGLRGSIYIDPSSANPQGHRPSEYGLHEHAKGGAHAFYARTEQEAGYRIAQAAGNAFMQGLR